MKIQRVWLIFALVLFACDDEGSVNTEDTGGGMGGSDQTDAETDGGGGIEPPDMGEPDGSGGEGGAGGEMCPGEGDDCTVGPCTGTLQCSGNGDTVCVGPAETCNGLDDDCDGVIDNGFDVGGECTAVVGGAEVPGMISCGPDGVASCLPRGEPVPETCNGTDDDQDGQIDEGSLSQRCYDGPEGSAGTGVCLAGVAMCQNGVFGACEGAITPIDELCDGRDNDCDGSVDEGQIDEPCFDGPDGTVGVGLCQMGSRSCNAGALGACVEQVIPAEEICDTFDNDCDGSVDEGLNCDCEPGEGQACYNGPMGTIGVGVCVGGRQICTEDNVFGACIGAVLPSDEICDGVDNNCNGAVDEEIPGVGEVCTVGIGECAVETVRICDGQLVICPGEAGAPVNERCDTFDNDCDGSVDETFRVGEACAVGLGACMANGVLICGENEAAICDATPGEPGVEQCDGVDNNCDGIVDNAEGLGEPCSVGVGACIVESVVTCSEEGAGCHVNPGSVSPEICDGIDNDCDGMTDEGNAGGGLACNTGEPGQCGVGATVCVDGGLECQAQNEPGVEICDGIDNDCNGVVDDDEGGGPLSVECYTGPDGTSGIGLCSAGSQSCENGQLGVCVGQILPGVEVCDSVDNSCNGNVDDIADGQCACEPGTTRACYTGQAGTEGVGVCREGEQRCRADGLSFEPCVGEVIPGAEVCDGLDNDCNGQNDDVLRVGDACAQGQGQCLGHGVFECRGDRVVCTAILEQPTPETCDGLDNDCNGVDDDVAGLGEACQAGIGECARVGERICGEGPEPDCSAIAGDPMPEACDGLDNDCDGLLDEDLGLGDRCTVGDGVCARSGVLVCGQNGADCNVVAGQPEEESCNGLDDDCDGRVDEDPVDAGRNCNTGIPGICARGRTLCAEAALICEAIMQPQEETCDGQDEDCNGATDDMDGRALQRDCYEGARGTEGVGLCLGGRALCRNGQFGACIGQVLPAIEICDSLDNDCNGEVDDTEGGACVCEAGEVRDCYTGPRGTAGVGVCASGQQECAANGQGWGRCRNQITPRVEVCDGLDEDCNGTVDDADGVGQRCAAGQGACRAVGLTICDEQLGQVICGAMAEEPGEEICNGIDDNCDGHIDNVPNLGQRCTAGQGLCRRGGRRICDIEQGELVCDAQEGRPRVEICNALDDDCDGAADEDLGLGERCTAGQGVCLAAGIQVCGEGGEVICNAEIVRPGVEACNGLDDDCDGSVDEGNPGGGRRCNTGQPGICAAGRTSCRAGELSCDSLNEPGEEICDGLDNDCNGTADLGPRGAPLNIACYDGPRRTRGVGLCHDGLRTCRDGNFGRCAGQLLPGVEICDDEDNDCDGETDNLADGACVCEPGQARGCYDGPRGTAGVGICRAGEQSCRADGTGWGACEGDVTPQRETCDGQDNNCDRLIDNVAGAGDACSVGQGICAQRGTQVCNAASGRLVCDAVEGRPRVEICNGLDDNCNGVNDDVDGLGDRCTNGIGICRRGGSQVCDLRQGALICNAIPGEMQREVCDAQDNDCDGETDENMELGGECTAGIGACQQVGEIICDANGGTRCSAIPNRPRPEICDAIDNDCDREIDEETGGAECITGLPGICAVGVTECARGRESCQPLEEPRDEICNQIDDNCDGLIDVDPETKRALQVSCYSGPRGTEGVGICHAGVQMCRDGHFGRCVGQALPQDEVCDSLDNDCNGIDDDLPNAECVCEQGEVRACYSGPRGTAGVGLCRSGTQACNRQGTGWGLCEGQVLPLGERCDGRDNNCNGEVDDGRMPGVGQRCSEGEGICAANGATFCARGQIFCSAQPGEPEDEICNRLDDDCDGEVDNHCIFPDCDTACQELTRCGGQDRPVDICPGMNGGQQNQQFYEACRNDCEQQPMIRRVTHPGACMDSMTGATLLGPNINEMCGQFVVGGCRASCRAIMRCSISNSPDLCVNFTPQDGMDVFGFCMEICGGDQRVIQVGTIDECVDQVQIMSTINRRFARACGGPPQQQQ